MASKKINLKFSSASKSGSTSVYASASKSASASGFASASAKTDGSKLCIAVKNILDVTAGNMGPITRNQAKLLGQQALRVSSESSIAFGLSPKCVKSHMKAAKEDIAEMVERIVAQLSLSTYKNPFALIDDDVLSTVSTPHNMFGKINAILHHLLW
uniref:Uncharacterized protein n=1 Tax=Solanum tuberosum TaxID=4113 RepID=M1DXX5_SOLTU